MDEVAILLCALRGGPTSAAARASLSHQIWYRLLLLLKTEARSGASGLSTCQPYSMHRRVCRLAFVYSQIKG